MAHSLGCLLAARLAGQPASRRVRGALLVAPCDLQRTNSIHPGRILFGDMPTQRLPFPAVVVGSLNDSYMALDRLTFFGRCWNAEIKNIGNAGHINRASGFGRWSRGYQLFDGLKAQTRHKRAASLLPAASMR